MSERPLIAVSAASEADGERCAAAVERAEGRAWLLLPGYGLSPAEVLARAPGLLISGATIEPGWYGAARAPGGGSGPEGDAAEAALLLAALEADAPVLGIGRGMQALNVVTGGLPGRAALDHCPRGDDGQETAAYHRIFIAPGSKLAAIVGAGGFVRVNSIHHEAIREPQKSPWMLASAYSVDDAVIEAIESPAHDWAIGVQFHPERRGDIPHHFERLFQGLAQRASLRRSASG